MEKESIQQFEEKSPLEQQQMDGLEDIKHLRTEELEKNRNNRLEDTNCEFWRVSHYGTLTNLQLMRDIRHKIYNQQSQ